MKRSKVALGIFIFSSVFVLNGCGSGGGSNTQAPVSGTVFNGNMADDSKIYFDITNKSGSDITPVIIKSGTNEAEIYNDNLNCPKKMACQLTIDKKITNEKANERLYLEFFGDNNKLVSASPWTYQNNINMAFIIAK